MECVEVGLGWNFVVEEDGGVDGGNNTFVHYTDVQYTQEVAEWRGRDGGDSGVGGEGGGEVVLEEELGRDEVLVLHRVVLRHRWERRPDGGREVERGGVGSDGDAALATPPATAEELRVRISLVSCLHRRAAGGDEGRRVGDVRDEFFEREEGGAEKKTCGIIENVDLDEGLVKVFWERLRLIRWSGGGLVE